MPTDRHRRALLAALAVIAMVIAACSSSGGDDGDAGDTSGNGTDTSTTVSMPPAGSDPQPSSDTVAPTTPEAEPTGGATEDEEGAPPTPADSAPPTTIVENAPASPLAEYVTGVPGANRFDPAQYQRESRAHEEAIARCMAAEGFEYVPYVRNIQWTVVEGGALAVHAPGGAQIPDLPPDEFAAQYGYGLSTREPQEEELDDVDPNAAIVDAMSVAERVAYYQALLGAEQSLDGQGRPNAEMVGDPDACWEQAATEVWGDRDALVTTDPVLAAFAPLLEQIGAIEERVAADPRMVAADEAWSACMAAAGFPGYTDLNSPQTDVAERAREVMGTAFDPTLADPDELAELQRFEIAIATADHACRAGYGETYRQVRHDVEAQFVEQHRTELEQYRDALAAQAAEADG